VPCRNNHRNKQTVGFWGEPKTCPRNIEDAQSEKKQGKLKRKEKGKMKTSKSIEDNGNKMEGTEEKKAILCWICAKEHYAKNYPLKQKLNAL
jgi:hypothetical protein